MARRPVPLYDFKAFGAAIKAARNERGESRKKVSDELYISPRYLANIENKGQQPSLQVFYDLVTRYHTSSIPRRYAGWSTPPTPWRVSTTSSARWPRPNRCFPLMTACWKCCIWPWWTLRKNGPDDGRIGAWFTPRWRSTLPSACPNNTAVTGCQGQDERLRRPWHPLPSALWCKQGSSRIHPAAALN